jgi:hypothetical protein
MMMGGKSPKHVELETNVRIINWKIVASGWWFIWIVRWHTDLQTVNFAFKISAHAVCKMWIIKKTKNVALWNKQHFEEKNGVCSMFKILSTYSCWRNIYKMQHMEGTGTPVLYIGRTVLKG